MNNEYQQTEQQIHAFLEARKNRSKIRKVIDEIDSIIWDGRECLHAMREIHTAFNGEDRELVALAGWFFVISSAALVQTTTLHATKLTENRPDSVNIRHLINLVEEQGRKNPGREHEFKNTIATCRELLAALEPDITTAKEQRDHYIAHIDRSMFNRGIDRSSVEGAVLYRIFDGVEQVLENILRLLPDDEAQSAAAKEWPGGIMGPRGLRELFYFARIAVADPAVPDPSAYSKSLRDLARALRQVENDFES